jgi:DNA-binding CsgD family transcriptional regulator
MTADHWWRPMLVVALVSTGALGAAARHIDALSAAAAPRPGPGARVAGLRARLHAAAGRPEEAEAAFTRAAEMIGPDDPFLETALLHQDHGAFLLARGNRRDGVALLMKARVMLASAGAVPYLERLDARLAGAGIRSPARAGTAPTALTEREADVAALVSRGMTNAEIAAELYVSVNTVDYHLRHVFAKLGVRSRRELRARTGGTDLASSG